MSALARLTAWLLVVIPAVGAGKDLSGLYDRQTLDYWQNRYSVSTRKIFDQIIWPALKPEEKQRLQGVRLELPIDAEGTMKGQPLAFYARDDRVVMPIFSLKFLDDLCTAYAWLQVNGYSLETISEYTAMLEYQSTQKKNLPPLRALRIPENALKDAKVDELALGHFVTARTFLLLHELGHVFHRHQPISMERSRRNEQEADEFAATVMARTPLPPLGILVFFMADAHASAYPVAFGSREKWEEYRARHGSHPLTGERLRTLARNVSERQLSAALGELAKLLDDPDVHASIIATARATDESMLAPRRPGQLPATARDDSSDRRSFSGRYVGLASQRTEPGKFPIELVLDRRGDKVTGVYSFGLGVGKVDGTVEGSSLHFNWQWSGNYGRGVLRASADGSAFTGTWGYRESADNAGSWDARR